MIELLDLADTVNSHSHISPCWSFSSLGRTHSHSVKSTILQRSSQTICQTFFVLPLSSFISQNNSHALVLIELLKPVLSSLWRITSTVFWPLVCSVQDSLASLACSQTLPMIYNTTTNEFNELFPLYFQLFNTLLLKDCMAILWLFCPLSFLFFFSIVNVFRFRLIIQIESAMISYYRST